MLTAIILTAFFMLGALALDLSQRTVTAEQADHTAKFAALSALQAYSTATGTDVDAKIEIAVAQANISSGKNISLSVGGKNTADQVARDAEQGTALIPGKFYAEVPTIDGCNNPCHGADNVPCFVALNDVLTACERAGNETQPNAFRVVGKYFSDLRGIFSKIFDSSAYSVNVDVIAAFVPRRGMMMVDVSSSTFHATHWYDPPYKSWYSYYVSSGNTEPDAPYNTLWNNQSASRLSPPPGAPSNSDPDYSKYHYRSDYAVVTSNSTATTPVPFTGKTSPVIKTLSDSDYGSDPDYAKYHPNPTTIPVPGMSYTASQVQGEFRIDTFRDVDYPGPEPFNTIFKGLDSAVEAFKERAVTGDRLGLIFFDHHLTWPRVVKLTSDFDYLKKFTNITDSNFYDSDEKGLKFVLKHQIFPSRNSYSNVLMAATEALRQFDQTSSGSVSSVDFMVYFGDGLANCTSTANCNEDYPHYQQAIQQLHDFAVDTLFPRRIPFNVLLVGDHVGPHVLALSDGQGGCVQDTDARTSKTDLVRGQDLPLNATAAQWSDAYSHMSADQPFYQVNMDMYQIARATGGIWGPIRKYTTSASECQPGCTDSDPTTAQRITSSCKNAGTDVDSYIRDQIMSANPYMIVPGKSGQ